MNHTKKYKHIVCFCLMLALTALALCTPAMGGSAEASPADRRVPYQFVIDDLNGQQNVFGDERPCVAKDWTLWQGQKLTFSGWLAVDEGVTRYEYAFVPEGGAFPEWKECENTVITARPDLTRAGIPYVTGHETAGFTVTVTAPRGTDGYFDLYLRGVSGDDVFCDLLIVVNAAVGNPDRDDGKTHTVNLVRLAANPSCLSDGRFDSDGAVCLSGSGLLGLGSFDLSLFESVTVKYTVSESFVNEQNGDRAILGLKSAPAGSRTGSKPDPYRMADGKYDMTDSVAYGTVGTSGGTLCLDLTDVTSGGEMYLAAYAFGDDSITVTEILFTYTGSGASRAAVKIHFTDALSTYFYSPNACEISTVHDDKIGDVMRVSAAKDTNDAYIHFAFESLLQTKDFRLSADEYKFIVVLARTKHQLTNHNMTFYLCPGVIGGPTEACTKTATLINDGQWHYYLLDLRSLDTWQGIIHLWRFDMINGNAVAGDYVDYATVQFFRTEEAAKKAASADPLKPDKLFAAGNEAVELDMSEEEAIAAGQVPFAPAADRVYIFEEPATEPPADTETQPDESAPASEEPTAPAETSADEPDTVPPATEAETAAAGGCKSCTLPALLLLLPLPLYLRKKKYNC